MNYIKEMLRRNLVAENVKRQSFNLSKANNPGGGAAVNAVRFWYSFYLDGI